MNRGLLVGFGFLLLVFAGCSGVDAKQSGIPFIGGNSGGGSSSGTSGGVDISFSDTNFEPQKDNEFSLIMNMENYQNHPVDVRIKPTGFEWSYLKSGLDREFTVSLSAASSDAPSQNAEYLEGIVLSDFTGDYNWNPVFKYCYDAKTTFREQVCVPNKLSQCDATIDSSAYSNGPMKVNVDSIYPIGDTQIGVEFTVSDSSDGDVVNECFQDENKNKFGNKLTTEPSVKLGTTQGVCDATSSTNGYMINQDELTFRCSFDRSGDSSDYYASQIVVEFDYKYAQQVQKKILIRDLQQRYG